METSNNKKAENSSYRSILKGASLFGGVQIFQVLINIIRGKFVAAILGPAGWGISGLFTTSAQSIVKLSSLGLNLAITKEVSQATEDKDSLSSLVKLSRRIVLATSLIGALVCIFFSNLLSLSTFDTESYSAQFMLLGVFVFFTIAGAGETSILLGLRESKKLSSASVIGSITGLCVGVPMYYMWGTNGIVPAMCVLSLVVWGFYRYSVGRSVKTDDSPFSWKSNLGLIKKLVAIGLVLMASDMIGSLTTYLTQIFIRYHSDLSIVGLYSSAVSMTSQYSNVVFTAMAMDYLPRLAKVSEDSNEVNRIVNRQTELVSLIIMPIVTLFILCAPLVIRLLLTDAFLESLELMRWMALGVTFKALMYPLGYVAFAKDNRKLFFWLEGVTGNFLTLGLSCIFFYFYGLVGLGYAMVVDGICCLTIYYFVNRKMYGYRFSDNSLRSMVMAIIFTAGSLLITYEGSGLSINIALSVLFILSSVICLLRIRKVIKIEKREVSQSEK